jgi:hypothetical protein
MDPPRIIVDVSDGDKSSVTTFRLNYGTQATEFTIELNRRLSAVETMEWQEVESRR